MTVPTIALNDGTSIPQLGFGVFQVPPAETAATVTAALEAGYRHIDTAQMYGNEEGVGEAIAASGIARDELYVTTKLNNGFHRPDDARREFEASLKKLGLDRVDLFLIHWPLPTQYDGDFVSTWQTLGEFAQDGRASSIGVSNFEPAHLKRIIDETGVLPAVNQIEVHPFFGNEAARAAGAERRHRDRGLVADRAGQGDRQRGARPRSARSTAGRRSQVALRWHIERGDMVFPKSMQAERMRENFEIFDFSLTPDQWRDQRPRPGRGRPDRPEPERVRLRPRLIRLLERPTATRRASAPGLEQVRQAGALEVGEPGQQPALVVEVLADQVVDQARARRP